MGQLVSGLTGDGTPFRAAFLRFDAAWYFNIARTGYPGTIETVDGRAQQSSIAFFPLFPSMVRVFRNITGLSTVTSAQIVVTTAGLVSVIMVWLLVQRVWDTSVADRTAVLFCFFPGFMVWGFGYAEPLTVALAAACLLALIEERWLIAGLCAAVATATRPNALVLVLCCAVAAAIAVRRSRRLTPLVAPILAPAGAVAFMLFLWQRTGELGAWFRVSRDGWNQHFDGGIEVLRRVQDIFTEVVAAPNGGLDALIVTATTVIAFGLAWALWRAHPPVVLLVYSYALIGLALLSAGLGVRPRYVETAFPLLAAGAAHLRGVPLAIVAGVATGALLALTVVTTTTVYVTP
jgi:hypothetical protein